VAVRAVIFDWGRTLTPDLPAVLASAGARHITGQILHVNGDAHTTR
jgi:hypothetical protein